MNLKEAFPAERLNVPLDELTDDEVEILDRYQGLFTTWIDNVAANANGPAIGALLAAFQGRAVDIANRPRPPGLAAHPCRPDTESLRAFARDVGLDGRRRQVFENCIERGMSLQECADDLGISRETVRMHLRRLRQLQRQDLAMRGPRPVIVPAPRGRFVVP